jgi:hypothetical protein
MKTDYIATLVAVSICVLSAICAVAYHEDRELESMKSNIESAIVKGIDPIAVKCAYGKADSVCIVYAASKKNP